MRSYVRHIDGVTYSLPWQAPCGTPRRKPGTWLTIATDGDGATRTIEATPLVMERWGLIARSPRDIARLSGKCGVIMDGALRRGWLRLEEQAYTHHLSLMVGYARSLAWS